MTTLEIGQRIELDGQPFSVVGIDDYELTNLLGSYTDWTSYTFLGDTGERTWVSYGVAGDRFTRWAEVSVDEFQALAADARLDMEHSGVAEVTFVGDLGHSTPFAELTWLQIDGPSEFLVIERFLVSSDGGIKTRQPYYQTGTVLREFKP